MLTAGIVSPLSLHDALPISGLLLLKAIVSAVEGLEGLPKLSWLWMVIGPAVGLEVAAKLRSEVHTSELQAPAHVACCIRLEVELKAPLPVAVMVGVPALVSP